MKIILLLIFLLLTSNSISAQNTVIDSLQKILPTQKDDTSKINTLLEIGHQYFRSNGDSIANIYWSQAMVLSDKIDFKKGEAMVYFWRGQMNEIAGKQEEARKQYSKKLAIAIALHDKTMIGDSYLHIGVTFFNEDNYPEGLSNIYSALKSYEEAEYRVGITGCYLLIGTYYSQQGDFDEALKNQIKALNESETLGDKGMIAGCNLNLANTYLQLGDYSKALKCDSIGLAFGKQKNYKGIIASALGTIGAVYEKLGIINQLNGDHEKANMDFSEAEKNFKLNLELSNEIMDRVDLPFQLINLGRINVRLGNLSIAQMYLDSAIRACRNVRGQDQFKEYYSALTLLDSVQNNFQKALADHKLYDLFRDSISNDENSRRAIAYKTQYEDDKKDALTKAELSRQKLLRNGFIGGFAVMVLFAGIFFLQRNRIRNGKKLSDELLLNILPEETAEELKATGTAEAKSFDEVTVMFTDFKNFTQASEKMSAKELVSEINYIFSEFDRIISKHDIEKIKTIGDSYMCAGGLPIANKTNATDVVNAALDIQHFMNQLKEEREKENKYSFEIRIGIHSGPVVAGIVGIKKFAYDIWGDTVNIASRMESSGEAGRVNISGATYELVKDKFHCTHRGKIQAKNKGEVDMYFVERPI